MRVILTTTNQPADYETGYALRLIEQGRAIPAPKQPAGEEARAAEILSQRTVFKNTPLPPSEEGARDDAASEVEAESVSAEEWVKGEEAGAKPRRKSSKKAGDSNVAG